MADERAMLIEDGAMLIAGTMPSGVDGIGLRFEPGPGNVVAFWYLPNGETRDMTAAEMREWFRNG